MKKCVICGCQSGKIIFKEFGINVLGCRKCGHVFSSFPGKQDYDGYFGEEIEKDDHFWWSNAHEKMYGDFCKKFIKNKEGKLLDVGCGLGYFVKKISSYPDWDVYGYEISKPAVSFAKDKLELKNIFQGKVEESDFPKKCFDIITLWDVIEHIPDSQPLLLCLNKILKDDGILFIHTPNIKIQLPKARLKKLLKGEKEGGHYLEAKDHINIYSPKAVKSILSEFGFNKIKFIHFHPIQSVSGSKNYVFTVIKNLWFYFSVLLCKITFGKINLDNLFVVAKKGCPKKLTHD